MSMATEVKRHCESIGTGPLRGGFSLRKGLVWQSNRLNTRPFPIFVGKLIAERRCAKSGFQTDALYLYTDGSMLVVNRTVQHYTLAATQGATS